LRRGWELTLAENRTFLKPKTRKVRHPGEEERSSKERAWKKKTGKGKTGKKDAVKKKAPGS
jgi:hypothetical protein